MKCGFQATPPYNEYGNVDLILLLYYLPCFVLFYSKLLAFLFLPLLCFYCGETYDALLSPDVDLEHYDMMMKALQSYGHYQDHGDCPRTFSRTGTPLWDEKLSQLAQTQVQAQATNGQSEREFHGVGSCYSQVSCESGSSEKSVSPFKLAQCRLRYYDDNEEDERRRKRNAARRKKTSPKGKRSESSVTQSRPKSARSVPDSVLFPRGEMNGVLVDSVGHIYRASQPQRPRPRSALPCKFTDFVKLSGREFGWDRWSIVTSNHSLHISTPFARIQ